MKKTIDAWGKIDPWQVAVCSQAHIAYLVADAKADIAELAGLLSRSEQFIAGFDGDTLQDGCLAVLLADLRRVLAVGGDADD